MPSENVWPLPVVQVERKGNHIYTAEGEFVMNAYAGTARREVERLTGELAQAVAAAALIDDEESGDPTPEQILALVVVCDFGELTVREYLTALLAKVWEEREGFNGKRPWGDSGWEHELYRPMIDAGFLTETPGRWGGELSQDEQRKGDRLIASAIQSLADPPANGTSRSTGSAPGTSSSAPAPAVGHDSPSTPIATAPSSSATSGRWRRPSR